MTYPIIADYHTQLDLLNEVDFRVLDKKSFNTELTKLHSMKDAVKGVYNATKAQIAQNGNAVKDLQIQVNNPALAGRAAYITHACNETIAILNGDSAVLKGELTELKALENRISKAISVVSKDRGFCYSLTSTAVSVAKFAVVKGAPVALAATAYALRSYIPYFN